VGRHVLKKPKPVVATSKSNATSDRIIMVVLGIATALVYYKYDELRATRTSNTKHAYLLALFCLCVGLGFKISAVFFH
jgi:NADH:ubiquinone oxidoreductase subunit 2 (subunit N)